jgi:hypothetical protein
MRAMLETCTDVFPGYAVTMFVFEPKELPDREYRMPGFNYASTAPRADIIAVLKAFIAEQEREGTKLDRIDVEPPAGAPNTGGETTTGDGVVYT